MNAEELLAAFETLADAPNGIVQIRGLVLELAVRGLLVPQNPEEEPARALLERIEAEKDRLLRDKLIPKPRSVPKIAPHDSSVEVPQGWA